MPNGDEALPSTSPAHCCQSVKMFITLEPHGIYDQFLLSYTC